MSSQLVKALEEGNSKDKLIKGFKKCGIVPIDVTPLLARIPGPENSTKQDDAVAADQSLINILTQLCGDEPKRTKNSKRIAVVPGKSVSVEDIENQDPTENQTSSGSSKPSSKKKNYCLQRYGMYFAHFPSTSTKMSKIFKIRINIFKEHSDLL